MIPSPQFRHLYDDALATLIGWQAPDPIQEAMRRGFLEVLAADGNAVAKTGPPVHLTASCLVLSDDLTEVLLHLHGKAGMWLQFGGHLEASDQGVWDAARRETREESGLEVEPQPRPIDLDRHALGSGFAGCREHLDLRFVALADRSASIPVVSTESAGLAWWPIESLPAQTAPDLPRLLDVARSSLTRT